MSPSSARSHRSDPVTAEEAGERYNPTPRAGRNLYAAIGIGVALGALVLVSLFVRKELFVVVATAASVIGAREVIGAMKHGGINPPEIPLLLTAAVVPVAAYIGGPDALAASTCLGLLFVVVWRALGSPERAVVDSASAAFVTLYVPALVGFAMLLLKHDDGPLRIVTFIAVTICSDIGGYAVGVVKGKHPMAPSISPKKSWEGFAGSLASCVLCGALCVWLLLEGRLWVGALLGVLVVVAATLGDLCESMIKRDLGIKDMSNLIPGHGGLMDRLDSLLLAVPVCWAILASFVSTH